MLPGLVLPQPGTLVGPSAAYTPVNLIGLKIDSANPLNFNFLLHTGDDNAKADELNEASDALIRYFLAALTIPEKDMWVNLSPYEEERIIEDNFAQTAMGRDLLAQDYILKQLSASLLYPDGDVGKVFWRRLQQKAEALGLENIPTETFHKIWITPDSATIFEDGDTVYVAEAKLKVLLEEDYLALSESRNNKPAAIKTDLVEQTANSDIMREVIIPEITHEVNYGESFARLRQIYNTMILATWYKKNLQQSLLGQIYTDQSKVKGITIEDTEADVKIYNQYIESIKQGAFNFIKEEYDPIHQEFLSKKYFSGGFAPDSEVFKFVEASNLRNQSIETQTVVRRFVNGYGNAVNKLKVFDASVRLGEENEDVRTVGVISDPDIEASTLSQRSRGEIVIPPLHAADLLKTLRLTGYDELADAAEIILQTLVFNDGRLGRVFQIEDVKGMIEPDHEEFVRQVKDRVVQLQFNGQDIYSNHAWFKTYDKTDMLFKMLGSIHGFERSAVQEIEIPHNNAVQILFAYHDLDNNVIVKSERFARRGRHLYKVRGVQEELFASGNLEYWAPRTSEEFKDPTEDIRLTYRQTEKGISLELGSRSALAFAVAVDNTEIWENSLVEKDVKALQYWVDNNAFSNYLKEIEQASPFELTIKYRALSRLVGSFNDAGEVIAEYGPVNKRVWQSYDWAHMAQHRFNNLQMQFNSALDVVTSTNDSLKIDEQKAVERLIETTGMYLNMLDIKNKPNLANRLEELNRKLPAGTRENPLEYSQLFNKLAYMTFVVSDNAQDNVQSLGAYVQMFRGLVNEVIRRHNLKVDQDQKIKLIPVNPSFDGSSMKQPEGPDNQPNYVRIKPQLLRDYIVSLEAFDLSNIAGLTEYIVAPYLGAVQLEDIAKVAVPWQHTFGNSVWDKIDDIYLKNDTYVIDTVNMFDNIPSLARLNRYAKYALEALDSLSELHSLYDAVPERRHIVRVGDTKMLTVFQRYLEDLTQIPLVEPISITRDTNDEWTVYAPTETGEQEIVYLNNGDRLDLKLSFSIDENMSEEVVIRLLIDDGVIRIQRIYSEQNLVQLGYFLIDEELVSFEQGAEGLDIDYSWDSDKEFESSTINLNTTAEEFQRMTDKQLSSALVSVFADDGFKYIFPTTEYLFSSVGGLIEKFTWPQLINKQIADNVQVLSLDLYSLNRRPLTSEELEKISERIDEFEKFILVYDTSRPAYNRAMQRVAEQIHLGDSMDTPIPYASLSPRFLYKLTVESSNAEANKQKIQIHIDYIKKLIDEMLRRIEFLEPSESESSSIKNIDVEAAKRNVNTEIIEHTSGPYDVTVNMTYLGLDGAPSLHNRPANKLVQLIQFHPVQLSIDGVSNNDLNPTQLMWWLYLGIKTGDRVQMHLIGEREEVDKVIQQMELIFIHHDLVGSIDPSPDNVLLYKNNARSATVFFEHIKPFDPQTANKIKAMMEADNKVLIRFGSEFTDFPSHYHPEHIVEGLQSYGTGRRIKFYFEGEDTERVKSAFERISKVLSEFYSGISEDAPKEQDGSDMGSVYYNWFSDDFQAFKSEEQRLRAKTLIEKIFKDFYELEVAKETFDFDRFNALDQLFNRIEAFVKQNYKNPVVLLRNLIALRERARMLLMVSDKKSLEEALIIINGTVIQLLGFYNANNAMLTNFVDVTQYEDWDQLAIHGGLTEYFERKIESIQGLRLDMDVGLKQLDNLSEKLLDKSEKGGAQISTNEQVIAQAEAFQRIKMDVEQYYEDSLQMINAELARSKDLSVEDIYTYRVNKDNILLNNDPVKKYMIGLLIIEDVRYMLLSFSELTGLMYDEIQELLKENESSNLNKSYLSLDQFVGTPYQSLVDNAKIQLLIASRVLNRFKIPKEYLFLSDQSLERIKTLTELHQAMKDLFSTADIFFLDAVMHPEQWPDLDLLEDMKDIPAARKAFKEIGQLYNAFRLLSEAQGEVTLQSDLIRPVFWSLTEAPKLTDLSLAHLNLTQALINNTPLSEISLTSDQILYGDYPGAWDYLAISQVLNAFQSQDVQSQQDGISLIESLLLSEERKLVVQLLNVWATTVKLEGYSSHDLDVSDWSDSFELVAMNPKMEFDKTLLYFEKDDKGLIVRRNPKDRAQLLDAKRDIYVNQRGVAVSLFEKQGKITLINNSDQPVIFYKNPSVGAEKDASDLSPAQSSDEQWKRDAILRTNATLTFDSSDPWLAKMELIFVGLDDDPRRNIINEDRLHLRPRTALIRAFMRYSVEIIARAKGQEATGNYVKSGFWWDPLLIKRGDKVEFEMEGNPQEIEKLFADIAQVFDDYRLVTVNGLLNYDGMLTGNSDNALWLGDRQLNQELSNSKIESLVKLMEQFGDRMVFVNPYRKSNPSIEDNRQYLQGLKSGDMMEFYYRGTNGSAVAAFEQVKDIINDTPKQKDASGLTKKAMEMSTVDVEVFLQIMDAIRQHEPKLFRNSVVTMELLLNQMPMSKLVLDEELFAQEWDIRRVFENYQIKESDFVEFVEGIGSQVETYKGDRQSLYDVLNLWASATKLNPGESAEIEILNKDYRVYVVDTEDIPMYGPRLNKADMWVTKPNYGFDVMVFNPDNKTAWGEANEERWIPVYDMSSPESVTLDAGQEVAIQKRGDNLVVTNRNSFPITVFAVPQHVQRTDDYDDVDFDRSGLTQKVKAVDDWLKTQPEQVPYTLEQIAGMFDVSVYAVYQRVVVNEKETAGGKRTDVTGRVQDLREWMQNYPDDILPGTSRSLADDWGVSRQTVLNLAKENGKSTRGRTDRSIDVDSSSLQVFIDEVKGSLKEEAQIEEFVSDLNRVIVMEVFNIIDSLRNEKFVSVLNRIIKNIEELIQRDFKEPERISEMFLNLGYYKVFELATEDDDLSDIKILYNLASGRVEVIEEMLRDYNDIRSEMEEHREEIKERFYREIFYLDRRLLAMAEVIRRNRFEMDELDEFMEPFGNAKRVFDELEEMDELDQVFIDKSVQVYQKINDALFVADKVMFELKVKEILSNRESSDDEMAFDASGLMERRKEAIHAWTSTTGTRPQWVKEIIHTMVNEGLNYDEAKFWQDWKVLNPGRQYPKNFWNNEETITNMIFVALDRIEGFKDAREGGDIARMRDLYRDEVINYIGRTGNGQVKYFREQGGLTGLLSNDHQLFRKSDSPAELIRWTIPELIDVRNPDALNPLEVEDDYYTNPENTKYHILLALDSIEGFKEARERNDIRTMADLYRKHVIGYQSTNPKYRNGQYAFFTQVGGLWGLFQNPKSLPMESTTPAGLVRFALPQLIDFDNPDALDPLEVEQKYWSNVDNVKRHVLRALDSIDGFKEAREVKDIKLMASLYRDNAMTYQSDKRFNGQWAFFEERGQLGPVMSSRKYNPQFKYYNPIELIDLVLPQLIDDSNPDALQSREIRLKFWINGENTKREVLKALYTIPGFNKAHEDNDVKKMAELYRSNVINYVSGRITRTGQKQFFVDVGKMGGLIGRYKDYLGGNATPWRLMYFTIPEIVDENNPDALTRDEMTGRDASNMSESLIMQTVQLRESFQATAEHGIHGRVASAIVAVANRYATQGVDIYIGYQDLRAKADSIYQLLLLGAPQGGEVSIEAEGDEVLAKEAISEIEQIIASSDASSFKKDDSEQKIPGFVEKFKREGAEKLNNDEYGRTFKKKYVLARRYADAKLEYINNDKTKAKVSMRYIGLDGTPVMHVRPSTIIHKLFVRHKVAVKLKDKSGEYRDFDVDNVFILGWENIVNQHNAQQWTTYDQIELMFEGETDEIRSLFRKLELVFMLGSVSFSEKSVSGENVLNAGSESDRTDVLEAKYLTHSKPLDNKLIQKVLEIVESSQDIYIDIDDRHLSYGDDFNKDDPVGYLLENIKIGEQFGFVVAGEDEAKISQVLDQIYKVFEEYYASENIELDKETESSNVGQSIQSTFFDEIPVTHLYGFKMGEGINRLVQAYDENFAAPSEESRMSYTKLIIALDESMQKISASIASNLMTSDGLVYAHDDFQEFIEQNKAKYNWRVMYQFQEVDGKEVPVEIVSTLAGSQANDENKKEYPIILWSIYESLRRKYGNETAAQLKITPSSSLLGKAFLSQYLSGDAEINLVDLLRAMKQEAMLPTQFTLNDPEAGVNKEFNASGLDRDVGGIDLDSKNLNLQIKRNGKGVPLPVQMQDIPNINIDGLYPVILNITPVTNIPLIFSQILEDQPDTEQAGLTEIPQLSYAVKE